ncbi:MAG: hypothetical protein MJ107_03130 [Lachnospiraceae bacterium]|nr:hypothetical protein [Lachnospiraceae bacterium]
MKSKRMLLVKTFLKSTSYRNAVKYSTDKKRKNNSIGNMVAYGIVYLMLLVYVAAGSIGLSMSGMTSAIPGMCGILTVAMSFILTLLKSGGYLFGFKEYDMIVAMPFEIKDIVAAKFIYMYVKSLPMLVVMSLATYIGYAIGEGFDFWVLLIWLSLTFVMPVLPMVIASALGALIVRMGSRFKHKSIVQTVLIFVVVMPCFFARYFVESIFKEDRLADVMDGVANSLERTKKFLPDVAWFSKAVSEKSVLSIALLIITTVVVFELFFIVVSRSYRKVNSRLSSGTAHKAYELKAQKQNNMIKTIAFKEFKRMTGSTTYITNVAMGEVMVLVVAIAAVFVKAETLIATVTSGAPLTPSQLAPAMPVFIYFLLGMVPSTCCSPSLEGKNYWIMKSLPIDVMTDVKGKILFNIYLTVPVGLISMLAISYCFRSSFIDIIMSLVLITVLCLFSSVFGLRCGLKHRKLDWDNEVEVVKQGSAVASYLLPNMFASMIVMVAAAAINIIFGYKLLVYMALIAVYGLLTLWSWTAVKKYAKR